MKTIQPFFQVMTRELSRLTTKWPYFFIAFIGPLIGFFFVMWTFSANVPRNLPIAVVDLDHTAMSRMITRTVDATPIARIDRSFESLYQARQSMEKGEVEAVLLIPFRTEAEILRGRSGTISLYVNNANVLKGGLISSGVSKAISTLSTGIEMQMKMKKGLSQNEAFQHSVPVMLHSEVLFNPYISYSYFLTSSLLPVMLIVFTLLGSVYTLGNELKNRTAGEWLETSGDNILVALAGKMLPYTILYCCLAMVMNVILFSYLGVPLRGNLSVLLVGELLMILSYQCLGVFLVGLTSNLRLSLSLASAYTMMALTFSGLTFPVSGMPVIAQMFAHLFPFTFWLKIFVSQALRGEPAENAIAPMYVFWLFIITGTLLIPRLKYVLRNEDYWGKI